MTDAPVCHIPPKTPSTQPNPVNIPSIPPARPDVQSLMHTVNAMRQVIMILSGQQGLRGPQGAPGNNAKSKPARWSESNRQTEKVKVYNPNDKTQFIEVERINSLTMRDAVTGETWNWTHG